MENPHLREAQKFLAKTLTTQIHGSDAVNKALGNTEAYFSIKLTQESLENMEESEFIDHFFHTDKTKVSKSELSDVSTLLVQTLGLRKTKADVRRLMKQNGLTINGEIQKENKELTDSDLLYGKFLIIKCGKK